MQGTLDKAAALFAAHQVDDGMNLLAKLFEVASNDAAAREQLLAWILARVDDPHPQVGAHLALAGGALVENGTSPSAIGRAIVGPIERALGDAARMIGFAKQYGHAHPPEPDAPEEDATAEAADSDAPDSHADHDHDHDHDGHDDDDDDHDADADDHDHAVEIFGWSLTDDELEVIAATDPPAVQAWFSLEMWYRPAVAMWSRDRVLLRELQARPTLRVAIEELGGETATSHWLSVLLETVSDAPFVVLVPELEEAWSFTADGIVDLGQLTVLLSKALVEPLRRVGASGIATDEQLAVMAGDAPQSSESGYSSSFAFYPIEATDPNDGLPRDGIALWAAPGGTGTHSLPGDFLPGTIAPIDGVRLLVMVGPKAPGLRFVRNIQSARMFQALHARVTDVRSVPAERAAALFAIARAHGRIARITG